MCKKRCTRAYRFSGNTPASPAQWLYGLWRALPGDEFLFVTVAAGLRPKRPGRIAFATDSLASATDAGTTRFCRTRPPGFANWLDPAWASFVCAPRIAHGKPPCDYLARRRCRVHRISTHVRDDHDTPLLPGETGGVVKVICPTRLAKYF